MWILWPSTNPAATHWPTVRTKNRSKVAAPQRARFAEHAVIGHFIVQPVTQKPEVIEPFGQHPHQFPLALDVVEEEQEHQLEQDCGVDRLVTIVAVAGSDFGADEGKIHQFFDLAQRVIGADTLIQVDVVTEQFFLWLVDSHHDGNSSLHDAENFRKNKRSKRTIWATGPTDVRQLDHGHRSYRTDSLRLCNR